MLISSHLFAHHAKVRGRNDPKKFVYVHTPARYIWNPELDERGNAALVRAVAPALRTLDRRRANEGADLAANSRFVQRRIRDAWGVDARVIYPPVDVGRISSVPEWHVNLSPADRECYEQLPDQFLLGASRFVSYKRLDDVIRLAAMTRVPVVLAGGGPEASRLREFARELRAEVTFIERPSDALLYALYQRCLAYVFPPVEDFGIMPVEAMAAGAVVIANRQGGAAESVQDGKTGALVDFRSKEDLTRAVDSLGRLDPSASKARAKHFAHDRFENEIARWVAGDPLADGARP
ncbi:glycosyltransferase [Cellulomonas sp. KH9]|uniref:glycosyltransferase n=1 Tax=Cellulomonas sp. KH9 TaxID=1855324 RepID=UPI002100E72F|nr:glycosyltransferase [Cellulomonas sp. KH9]